MSSSLLSLVCAVALAPAPQLEAGTQLSYRGTFQAADSDDVNSRKTFELAVTVERDDDGAQLFWSLAEAGRGAWHWTSRFGRRRFSSAGKPAEGHDPLLLYQRESGTNRIGVLLPVWTYSEPLKNGASWEDGTLSLKVTGRDVVAQRRAWRVEVRNRYGRKRTVWIDPEHRIILKGEEVVFIGQGERHELTWQLTGVGKLAAADLGKQTALHDGLFALRAKLGVEPGTREVNWTEPQLGLLRSGLAKLDEAGASPPIANVIKAARADSRFQKNRSGTLAGMRKQILGRPLPAIGLKTLTGKSLDPKDVDGKVRILHFWRYRDKPLEEPYGQVGFIDFLYRQRKSDDIVLVGVHVDPRLADERERSRAVQTARRLKSFMRLSYPILLDDGKLLESLGDPRAAGAKLPLVVVTDRKGRVVHFHAGFYKVDSRRGLVELDDVVKRALAGDTSE